MFRIILILSIAFVIIGCTTIRGKVADYNACMADPACVAEVQIARVEAERKAELALGALPKVNKYSKTIAKVIGSVVSLLVAVKLGGKLRIK